MPCFRHSLLILALADSVERLGSCMSAIFLFPILQTFPGVSSSSSSSNTSLLFFFLSFFLSFFLFFIHLHIILARFVCAVRVVLIAADDSHVSGALSHSLGTPLRGGLFKCSLLAPPTLVRIITVVSDSLVSG